MRTQYTTHMAPKESDIGSVFDACVSCYFLFFFFQAEDGIRDHCVTGVQTCALPISWRFVGVCSLVMFRPANRSSTLPIPTRGIPASASRSSTVTPTGAIEKSRRYAVRWYAPGLPANGQIGRASCRERAKIGVCGESS